MSETIGFIGLGNMGGPMCDRLIDHGFDVVASTWSANDGRRLSPMVAGARRPPPSARRAPTCC